MERLRYCLACSIDCCYRLMYQAPLAVFVASGLSSTLLNLPFGCSYLIAHKAGIELWELCRQAFDRCIDVHALGCCRTAERD